jgi:hypothetical protein
MSVAAVGLLLALDAPVLSVDLQTVGSLEAKHRFGLIRVGAGVHTYSLSGSIFYEHPVLRGGEADEGCNPAGTQVHGCTYDPRALGADLSVHPWKLALLRPRVFVATAWARRSIAIAAGDRDDLVLWGGLGIDLLFHRTVEVGFFGRYARYPTFPKGCCGNEQAVAVGVGGSWLLSL